MNLSLDIIHIHDLIIKHFESETEKLKFYETQLAELQKNNTNENISTKVKKTLQQQEEKLTSTIQDVKKNSKYNFYMFNAVPLIERYKELIKTPVKISFMNSNIVKVQKNQIQNEKVKIVNLYMTLLKKNQFQLNELIPDEYINEIVNFESIKSACTCEGSIICSNCKNDVLKCEECQSSEFDIDGNLFTCTNCGVQADLINTTSCIKDIDRINISSKYTYDRRSHFKECINQFQAKQNQNIPDKVFDDLYHQIKIHNLIDGTETDPPEVRYKRLNKEHIQMFLKELNHTKYYEDIIYIYYKITNKPPEDISHIESKLMEDFDVLIELYDKKYKNSTQHKRKNFINIQCILYQLLLKHGYKCKRSDFNILKTVDKKAIHDEIIYDLFKDLSWNFQHMC
jgi:hypothetical protein